MSDTPEVGVLYTEHSGLKAMTSVTARRCRQAPPIGPTRRDAGFYDQAHMINEFRTFAGSPPTVFFRPHDSTIDPAMIRLRGRPSEWLRRTEPVGSNEYLLSS